MQLYFHRWHLFEKQNSQGNQWIEEQVYLYPVDEEFQIVFEATGSRAIISDIAIDDVALLNDGICRGETTTESITEDDGIYQIQSCVNRCNETQSIRSNGSKPIIDENHHITEKCDCHSECGDMSSCCFDYLLACFDFSK